MFQIRIKLSTKKEVETKCYMELEKPVQWGYAWGQQKKEGFKEMQRWLDQDSRLSPCYKLSSPKP